MTLIYNDTWLIFVLLSFLEMSVWGRVLGLHLSLRSILTDELSPSYSATPLSRLLITYWLHPVIIGLHRPLLDYDRWSLPSLVGSMSL
ncbi:hypothetical protein F5148DRAFT_1228934 [Russula earlei]|uniref:Uncharacterized protein n=1 Tax=Russula earlei TaxID=71964 RepID=A0ACC0U0S4_9AGAM|nr:hypothetical protein F5148DRAFT_1228934 [Russula earlei]